MPVVGRGEADNGFDAAQDQVEIVTFWATTGEIGHLAVGSGEDPAIEVVDGAWRGSRRETTGVETEFEPDPPEPSRCGSCSRCIPACPTAAITAPYTLDARRCISYLTIELKGPIPIDLRPLIGNRIFGCDDCLAACPWNRFAREGAILKGLDRPDLTTPVLIDLLKLDEPNFKARFKGSPILRSKRRGFLRNVCVALGNVGDRSALPALDTASSDPEPLIAEHASWAANQIRSRHHTGR